jgi:2-hydroxy-3-keto-5-methylthiopentenyl-1-phosphate phosphatase
VLDFDGTITEVDLLQQVSQHFGEPKVVDAVEQALRDGEITLREEITREYSTVRADLDEVLDWILARARIRAGFDELLSLVRESGWSVRILSSGFVELIGPVLAHAGIEGIEILANGVDPSPDGWRVQWRDESVCAECGEACKRAGLPIDGEVVYVGDGISDRCAARAADRVFATRGLARYFDEHGLPYERFDDFHDIVRALTD